jgi:hypothetical protein
MMTHPRIRNLVMSAFVFGAVSFQQTRGEQTSSSARNEYAKIDVTLTNDAIQVLKLGNRRERHAEMARIQASPQKYAPLAFCVMGEVMFNEGEVDEGSFWFYAGLLRATYDAQRCTDASARSAVRIADRQYGVNIRRYVAQEPETMPAFFAKVVEWDRKTPYEYDPRWINLHGEKAMTALTDPAAKFDLEPFSVPEEQWAALAEKTRRDFVQGVHQALQAMNLDASSIK